MLSEPILSSNFKLDETNLSRKISLSRSSLIGNNLLFILIERDSETPIEQIDPIIRVHYNEIYRVFKERNYIEIEKYLGDEDILGMKMISNFEETTIVEFEMKGVHKMDKYEYRIKIE